VQRKFIINLGLLLFLNFLIKPFWIFGIDREVQILFPDQYGVYFALFNFSLLFNIVLDLGITNFNSKNIAQNTHLLSKYFSGIVVFKFLLAVIYMVATAIVGFIVGYDSNRFSMLLFLTLNQFLVSFTLYLRSNITGLQLFTLDSLLSVLDKTLMIIFCAVLLWGNLFSFQFNLMHFVYAQTWAYAIAFIFIFFIVLSKTKEFTFKVDWQFIRKILKQTYPYALLVIAMMFYYRLDAIMLDLMLEDGERQAAIYAQSYRLMDAFIQIPILFAGMLLPMFAFRIKKKQSINELLKISFEFIFVISITVALVISIYSEDIIELLYHYNIKEASKVLQVLIFGFISIAMTNIFGTVLTAYGEMKFLNIIAISGVIINLILNIIFIPKMGAFGAAFASIITHFIVVFFQIIQVIKITKSSFNFKYLLTLLVFVLCVIGIVVGLNYKIEEPILKMVVALIGSLGLSMILRIINLKKLFQIVLNRKVESDY
jgi:O-antigen/teichoic acid export membrane protein